MSRRTVDAIVLSHAPNISDYFAYSNQISRDLIINYSYVPAGKNILGKWIRAEVRDPNSVCQPVKIIDDLFETRITGNNPEIKVEAFYDGRFEDKINVFFNRYFGNIFDIDNIIRNVDMNRPCTLWITRLHQPTVRARWRVSPKQNQCHSDNLRTVKAIVHSLSLDGNRYIAWSEVEPRDKISIMVDKSPSTSNILGRWIEVTIDKRNFVAGPIQIIPDVFETRSRYGTTEVLVDFEDTDNSSGMFYSLYFGNIYDPNQMINQKMRNSWYRAWIVFFYKPDIDTRWRLSRDQAIEGPFPIERNQNEQYHSNQRNSLDENDERPNRNQYSGYREDYDDMNYRDRNQPSFNSSTYPSTNSNHGRDDYGNYPTETSSYSTCKRTYGSETKNMGDSHQKSDRYQNGDDNPDKHRSNNRAIFDSDNNGSSTSMDRRNRSQNERVDEVHSSDVIRNHSEEAADIRSESTSTSTEPNRIAKSKRTPQEKTLLKMKNDLARMSHLVQSLTKDCSVSDMMKLLNNDSYEELMELTKLK